MAEPFRSSLPSRRKWLLVSFAALAILTGFGLPRLVPVSPPQKSTAADSIASTVSEPTASSEVSWNAGKVIIGLAMMTGACILIVRTIRQRRSVPTGGVIEFISSLAVDARCTVSLVRVGSKRLLVGHDSGGVKATIELPGAYVDPHRSRIESARVSIPSKVSEPFAVGPEESK